MILQVIFTILLIVYILPYLANHTNLIGKCYAKLFIWLQEFCNLCLIRSKLPSIDKTNEDANTFITSYSKWFYWTMNYDKYRMNAYDEAIKKLSSHVTYNWIDIGSGAHMPMSRLVLKNKVASHIHAVESNPTSYASACHIRSNLEKKQQDLISLYSCYSTDLSKDILPQPTAIIHEIIGTVSSSEGAVSSIVDLLSKFPTINQIIPYRFGTLCVPVSWPSTSVVSSFASLLFGGSISISREAGVQCLYNAPKTWMAEPQLIEEYSLPILKEMSKSQDNYTSKKTVNIPITRRDICCGLYLSPLIQCDIQDIHGMNINGLKTKTNWGVEYVSLGNDKALFLEIGDVLEVQFTAFIDKDCPTYCINVLHLSNNTRRQIYNNKWKGPQDNMMI